MKLKDFIKNWRSGYWIFFVLLIFNIIIILIPLDVSGDKGVRIGMASFDISIGLFIIWLGARRFFKKVS